MSSMRHLFNLIILAFLSLWMFVLVKELYSDIKIIDNLNQFNKGLPESSESLKIARNDKKYVESQHKALDKRRKRIYSEIITLSMIFITSATFLDTIVRARIFKLIRRLVGYVPKFRNNARSHEISFVSLFCTLFTLSIFGGSLAYFLNIGRSLTLSICVYIILLFSIFPFLYLIIKKFFKLYGYRFIVACYIAYFSKAISEFFAVDDVDLNKMQNVDINVFGSEVQNFLREKHLENKVYSEKSASDSLNAALVGWGFFERIEIYGEYSKLDKNGFESVLLHEIGHSQDSSLVKKMSTLFAIKFLEMFILVYLYSKVSKSYSDSLMGLESSFCILYLIYQVFMSKWLLCAHKMVSQIAERNADQIAKNLNYGKPLAKVLYDITVTGNQSIMSTYLYNAIKSYHPSIYSRIEHLNS